jgi:cytochrome c oxidase cbb3-type subunit 3
MRTAAAALALGASVVLVSGCEREARPFRSLPASSAPAVGTTGGTLHAGGPLPPDPGESPYRRNAWGISEGKRLYAAYNCSGCHAQGGGGIGPPLMDDEWIYGFEPADIFRTIVDGRANGMPSFRGRVSENQVWQLVSYVASMSGQTPTEAAPGRSDHMGARRAELISPYQGRRQTGHK